VSAGFILQIAAIAIGGGSVQLVIFLLRRRSELHKLDAESDATLLDSANVYIATLQTGEKALREENAALKEGWANERAAMRKEWDSERTANIDALESSNREVSRFRLELARVQADLLSAQAQIDELRGRLTGP
jgi:hypothetical protein